jgi:hypothetical protein
VAVIAQSRQRGNRRQLQALSTAGRPRDRARRRGASAEFADGHHTGAILADIPNYTNTKPIIQISEIAL